MKETDSSLGCIFFVIAVALIVFFLSHGPEIANAILGHC